MLNKIQLVPALNLTTILETAQQPAAGLSSIATIPSPHNKPIISNLLKPRQKLSSYWARTRSSVSQLINMTSIRFSGWTTPTISNTWHKSESRASLKLDSTSHRRYMTCSISTRRAPNKRKRTSFATLRQPSFSFYSHFSSRQLRLPCFVQL